MYRFFFISIGLFVVMLSSCRSSRQVVQQTQKDSTSVTFRDVEKIVHIEGDTIKVNMQAALDTPPSTATRSGDGALKFIPQVQNIETKRTKVTIELTKSGEIKATAISKDVDEKVTVQEKTISNYHAEKVIVEQKESAIKKAISSFKNWLIWSLLAIVVFALIKFASPLLKLFKTLFK